MRRLVGIVILAAALAACGPAGQHRAINDARYGILAAGAAIDAMDQAADAAWCHGDPADTDAYCKCKRAALIIAQGILAVEGAAGAVAEWETALVLYEARKSDVGWMLVTDHAAEWFSLAGHLIAVADAVRATLEMYGVKLPGPAAAAWKYIAALSPDGAHDPVEWDWTSLQGGVCEVKP